MSAQKRFVTVKEAADAAGVHEKTIRRWCYAQLIDARVTPSGAQWRIAVDEDGFPVRR